MYKSNSGTCNTEPRERERRETPAHFHADVSRRYTMKKLLAARARKGGVGREEPATSANLPGLGMM